MHSVARVVRLVAATHKLALLNNQIFNNIAKTQQQFQEVGKPEQDEHEDTLASLVAFELVET